MPIFGDNSAGTQTFNASSNRAYLDRFTLSEAGAADSLSVYVTAAAANIGVKALIYTDASGAPGSLVAVSAAGATTNTAAHWLTLSFAGESLPAGEYWIGIVTNNFGRAFGGDTTGDAPNMVMSNGLTYTAPQSTWPSTTTSYTARFNAYVTYTAASGVPTISSVSDTTPAHASSLTITGTNFGASQGTGGVTIGGIAQTVTAWSDTSITVTVGRGTNKYGVALNVVVTADGGAGSSPFALGELTAQAGWAYVNVGTPNTTASNRITASPDIASGDQIAYETAGGLVEVFADATFSAGADVTEFDVEVWTSPDGWGSTATQTLSSGSIAAVDGIAAAAGQASTPVAAVASATAAAAAAQQAAAGASAAVAVDAASAAPSQTAAGPLALAAHEGAAAAAGQVAAPARAFVASGGAAVAPQQSVSPVLAATAVTGFAAAPGQATGDTGGTITVAVDGSAGAAGQAVAASGAAAAVSADAAGAAQSAGGAAAIHVAAGAAQAPQQAAAEFVTGTVVAVDCFAGGAGQAAASAFAIAAAGASVTAAGQAAGQIVATAAVAGAAQSPEQASADSAGRQIVAVDAVSGAPQQAVAGEGAELEPPIPQPGGGGGRLVSPSFPLPKRGRGRVVAVDGISTANAQAAASVQAVIAVAGAAASAAQLGTAALPVGAMVADQWLAARMQELQFERTMLENF